MYNLNKNWRSKFLIFLKVLNLAVKARYFFFFTFALCDAIFEIQKSFLSIRASTYAIGLVNLCLF